MAATIYFSYRESGNPEEIRRAVQEQARVAARESAEAIRSRVTIGMTREYVEFMLGDPDDSRQMADAESRLELWDYECRDGARVQISILDGKVQSITH
jgi:hypothetical protein